MIYFYQLVTFVALGSAIGGWLTGQADGYKWLEISGLFAIATAIERNREDGNG